MKHVIRLKPVIGILLVLIHGGVVGQGLEACGFAVYDPAVAICCNLTLHVMSYEYTCCCGEHVLDASVDTCCEGEIIPKPSPDMENCCKCPDKRLDIVIMADNSEGLTDANLQTLRAFVKDVISGLDVDSGDVRCALVVFTHNVYIEFYLNTFSTKADMLNAIDNLDDRTGGTETGRALKTVREEIFIEANGHREGVPKIALLVTDGDSNDPDDTIEQVDLLKATGVFVMTVGIGPGIDIEELNYVATGSDGSNVINVTSFDALDTIQSQIHDMFFGCKDFPSRPLCGTTPFDPSSQLCCQGNVHSVTGQLSNFGCCGSTVYNRNTQKCCGGENIIDVDKDPSDYGCCSAHVAFHVPTEKCCEGNNVAVSGFDPMYYMCCGDQATYEPSLELCCNTSTNGYNVVSIDGRAGQLQCCGDSGAFDVLSEICCLGEAVPFEDGCCGDDEYFDPDVHICCGGIVQPRYGFNTTACCNGVSYSTNCFDCQNDELVSLLNETTHICCGGAARELVYENNCCCGETLFDSTRKMCCDGNIEDKPDWDDSACCACSLSRLDVAIAVDYSNTVVPWHDEVFEFVKSLIVSSNVDDGQDRVALLVYAYDIVPVFYLNANLTTSALLDATTAFSYSPGKTDTSTALVYVKDSVFTPGRGDRDDVPNVVVFVLDGNTEQLSVTLAAATALKATGTKIVCVGVGDIDIAELEQIASDPSNKHVFRVSDFEALAELDIPIKVIAQGDCVDPPVPPPRPQCNGVSYSNRTSICCNGIVEPRLSGEREECCGHTSYDRMFYICCEGSVQPRTADGDTKCCCRQSFNPASHICCGNSVRIRTAGEYTECCGKFKYDNRSEVCCLGQIQRSYGQGFTGCCNFTSYNEMCYSCNANHSIVPLFNPDSQVCCDGTIEPMKYGDESCCCGTTQFSLVGQLCCEGTIRQVPDVSTCACCGDRLYDVKLQMCCDGNTRNRPHGNMTVCCGRRVMDADSQLCCDGKIVDKISPRDSQCCSGVPYNPAKQTCCEDTLLDKPTDDRKSSRCCGKTLYDPVTHFCCGGVTNTRSSGKACCDSQEVYTPSTDTCDAGHVSSISTDTLSPCGDTHYNSSVEMCCAGTVQPIVDPSFSRCCHDTSYDVRESTCCHGVLYESKPETQYRCCLKRAYHPRRRVCCNGRLVSMIIPNADQCCGRRRSFNPRVQVCCNGRVNDRVSGVTTQCCGKKSFDPTLYVCCSRDVLLRRRYGESTACCGEDVYHPKYQYCCNEQVISKGEGGKLG